MKTRVEIKAIPEHGLFIYRKRVWRSMGKLISGSCSTTAQRVVLNKDGIELVDENADFIDSLRVTPYFGEVPKALKHDYNPERSWYQYCIDKLR